MGQQLLGKPCSNGNELATNHDVTSKDPPKSNKPCVDTSILEGSLDETATTVSNRTSISIHTICKQNHESSMTPYKRLQIHL